MELSMVHDRVVASMFDMYNRMKVLQEKRIVRIIVHKPLLRERKGQSQAEGRAPPSGRTRAAARSRRRTPPPAAETA